MILKRLRHSCCFVSYSFKTFAKFSNFQILKFPNLFDIFLVFYQKFVKSASFSKCSNYFIDICSEKIGHWSTIFDFANALIFTFHYHFCWEHKLSVNNPFQFLKALKKLIKRIKTLRIIQVMTFLSLESGNIANIYQWQVWRTWMRQMTSATKSKMPLLLSF